MILRQRLETFPAYGVEVQLDLIDDDEDDFNPRRRDNNLARLAFWHRRHLLGDEQIDTETYETAVIATHGFGLCVAILPIYIYDHGAITIATTPFSCPWDSGQVGWGYITRDAAIRHGVYPGVWTGRQLNAAIEREVKDYNAYLWGEIYRYKLVEPRTGALLHSDAGYLDLEACREAAVCAAEACNVDARLTEHDVVPVHR